MLISNTQHSCIKKFKPLQELNLIDSFLFSASTEKTQNAEFIAKLIIERATEQNVDKISVAAEKSLSGIDIGTHGIRMDLFVEAFENERLAKVYDIEPNKYAPSELPMRSRYSQSLTDVKLLKTGDKYHQLPEYISIWILPYDPFMQNQMIYTVKNCIEDFPNLVYNDGVKKLFLYVNGELGGTESLKNLLLYFSESNQANVVDSELEQLHSIVETIKHNQKVGMQYMTLQDMIDQEKLESFNEGVTEGRAEGRAEARSEGILTLIGALTELQISAGQIKEQLIAKYGLTPEEADKYLSTKTH